MEDAINNVTRSYVGKDINDKSMEDMRLELAALPGVHMASVARDALNSDRILVIVHADDGTIYDAVMEDE